MSLQHRFKLVFTREIVTDEGYLVNEKPPIIGQIYESDHIFKETFVSEQVITEIILQKLYEGLKAELKKPNTGLLEDRMKNKKIEKIEEPEIQTIIPLHPIQK